MNISVRVCIFVFLCAFFSAAAPPVFPTIIPQDIKVASPHPYAGIYSDSAGESHFEDLEIAFNLADFAPPAPPISVSQPINAEAMVFISSPSGWFGDWHPTPNRQYIFMMSGVLEVEVSDGEIRRFKPGDIIFVEDTTGKGHVSRVVGKDRVYCAALTLKKESE